MTILGIETSCDETAAAVVQDGTILLSNVVASSQDMHAKYGGIIPDRAAREQLKSIIATIHEAVFSPPAGSPRGEAGEAGIQYQVSSIDAIAVTTGPGLIGCLLVGVETAKSLALAWNKPLIPVNHLVGHIYANWITTNRSNLSVSQSLNLPSSPPPLPALVLLVSGGHTDLILMTDHGKFTHLGSTRDDAAGECFDKCGRVLGLPYPYGPLVEVEAQKFDPAGGGTKFETKLPRPLVNSKDFDFSFSGLKTAFLNEFNRLRTMNDELVVPHLAYELQEAITDCLVAKTLSAWKKYQPPSIIIAGGVAANKRLREKFKLQILNLKLPVSLFIPPIKLCTDNAAHIAAAAYFCGHRQSIGDVGVDPELSISSFSQTR